MNVLINWLRDAQKYELRGKLCFSGPAPSNFDRDDPADMAAFYLRPWVISHSDAREQLWRAIGFEYWAVRRITEGEPIGIMVVPW